MVPIWSTWYAIKSNPPHQYKTMLEVGTPPPIGGGFPLIWYGIRKNMVQQNKMKSKPNMVLK